MSKPSYEVLKRYREKAIRHISIDLPKGLADAWEKKLAEDGFTKAGFVKTAIAEYLKEEADQ